MPRVWDSLGLEKLNQIVVLRNNNRLIFGFQFAMSLILTYGSALRVRFRTIFD